MTTFGEQGAPIVDEKTVKHLVARAMFAPSADNNLPFEFHWSGGGDVELRGDGSWPSLDRTQRYLAMYAAGAVAETFAIAASQIGFEAQWVPAGSVDDALIGHWSLRKVATPPDPLGEYIEARHTNRKLYSRRPVPDDVLARMSSAVAEIPRVTVTMFASRNASHLRALMSRAERERFRSVELHQELFGAIRFDVGWHDTAERGIPAGATEVEPFLRPFFKGLRHWSVMRIANALGAPWLLGMRVAGVPAMMCGGLAVLAVDASGDEVAFLGGRATQRLWLAAQGAGLAVQPFAAGPLLSRPFWHGVSAACRRDLNRAWEGLGLAGTPAMVLRFGYAQPPSCRAGRPPRPPLVVR